MRFVYKINSAYDGFTPARLPQRLEADGRLSLGWEKYIEAAEHGDEVWVYFRGPHRFDDGVYVKGTVSAVDVGNRKILLKVREKSTQHPLTDAATAARIAELAARLYQQVFLLPEEVAPLANCTLATSATTCQGHNCGFCPAWHGLTRIDPDILGWPQRLQNSLDAYVPAYWVLPPRTFLYRTGRSVRASIRRTSETFLRFKTGEKNLAYPLALGIYESLAALDLPPFDCIVPIPLSPDKEAAGEIHRTRLLARELAQLLDTDAIELLTLNRPISKKKLRGQLGYTASQFETAYGNALEVEDGVEQLGRVLLVDDVCTEGSTLRAATRRLHTPSPACSISAATAGQMAVRAAVSNAEPLLE